MTHEAAVAYVRSHESVISERAQHGCVASDRLRRIWGVHQVSPGVTWLQERLRALVSEYAGIFRDVA